MGGQVQTLPDSIELTELLFMQAKQAHKLNQSRIQLHYTCIIAVRLHEWAHRFISIVATQVFPSPETASTIGSNDHAWRLLWEQIGGL